MQMWQTACAAPCALGESPFWHPQEQMLYWADIAGCQLHRLNPFMGQMQAWPMPSEPGCFAPDQAGGFIIALRDRLVIASHWGSALQTLSVFPHDAKTTRANDGKCDASGRFWVGTLFEPRSAKDAALMSYAPGEGLRLKQEQAVVANSLAFSPDAKTVYWADTPEHTIWAWDFDLASGAMTGRRIFKQFSRKPEGWRSGLPGNGGYAGRPDGAAMDAQGHLWVAMFEGQQILRLSPQGDIVQSISTPVSTCTMPAFGGDDLQTLYLTSARYGRSSDEIEREPLMGCVFSLRVGVAGLPVNFYAGSGRLEMGS